MEIGGNFLTPASSKSSFRETTHLVSLSVLNCHSSYDIDGKLFIEVSWENIQSEHGQPTEEPSVLRSHLLV